MNKNTTFTFDLSSTRLAKALLATVAALIMTGCATASRGDPSLVAAGTAVRSDSLSVAEVRNEPAAHAQSEVIWGGTIAKIENRNESTLLEIIERPLNEADQPLLSDLSGGRFIATVPGFLDPADFRVGQPVTIDGSVEGIKIGKIGETAYDFPTVAVNDYQLWLQATNRISRRNGYYNPYYSSLRTSVFFGLGSRSRSSIGFGFGRGFGHRGFRGGHRGFGGRRGFRGRFRGSFTRGSSRF